MAGDGCVDLNADVGESLGSWAMGEDEALIPHLSSVNIACGFHAGDPLTIERTVRLALDAGAAIGAHPGYPDRVGFGRRNLDMAPDELEASLLYQIAAVAGIARAAGGELHHVKAHGALYNRAVSDPAVAETIARATRRISKDLVLVGLAGSVQLAAGQAAGLAVAAEGFPDRAYEPDGSLRSRRLTGAVLADSAAIAERAVSMARDGVVVASEGSTIQICVDTLCLHGDNPGAAAHAVAVRGALQAAGIAIRAVGG